MKLVGLLVATVALSSAFGPGIGTATATKKPNIAKKAKKICKNRRGKSKRKCIRKQKKRLRKVQKRKRANAVRKRQQLKKRKRQRAINSPPVTVRTTEYGIPRIVADNWRGLGFGYSYSLAKENICSLAEIYTTMRGERSKYFGPAGRWQQRNNFNYNNLQSDFFHKRLIADGTVTKVLKMKPPNGPRREIRAIVDGYTKGYNRYLNNVDVDNLSDVTCKGEPWVKPITRRDVYLHFFDLATAAGYGQAVDGIADAAPPLTGASTNPDTGEPGAAFRFEEEDSDLGSNAIALGREATSTGGGMLFGNPHRPWSGPERFFEAQMTIPGRINVSGASLLGIPAILIGHNGSLAWSHTHSTARRFNLFEEQLVPGKPDRYYLDGKQMAMKKTVVTVEKKIAGDTTVKETRTLYSTVHGPVVVRMRGLGSSSPQPAWSARNAYTLFDPAAHSLRSLNFFLGAGRARNVNEMAGVLKNTLGPPYQNTIAADSTGRALYADIGSIPNIEEAFASECGVLAGNLSWQKHQVAVLDGSRSDCDMPHAPGTPAKGLLPPARMPLQIRDDYTSNANDSYWMSNPNAALTGFPRIIGKERGGLSLRTRNGLTQIEKRLNGTDGNPGSRYTPELLRGLTDNNRNYAGVIYMPDLVSWCEALPDPKAVNGVDVEEACDVLAEWDRTDRLDSPGAYLARQVIERILKVSGHNAIPLNGNDPVHTPRGLDLTKPGVREALSDAVIEMNDMGISLNATWRDYQSVTRTGEKIPIPGGPGGHGLYNVINARWRASTGEYDRITQGSSFIIAASLDGSKCPDVKTILTYSQAATDESSSHYSDQTRLFSDGGWVGDRFCPVDQKASPDLEVKNLNGGAKAIGKGW